jgi:FlaA1/EpsC-like NDP-sugar epimerase
MIKRTGCAKQKGIEMNTKTNYQITNGELNGKTILVTGANRGFGSLTICHTLPLLDAQSLRYFCFVSRYSKYD